MFYSRRALAALGVLAIVALAGCVDSPSVGPGGSELPAPSAAVLTGVNGVWLLPPLDNTPPVGTFNPDVQAVLAMSVCQLGPSLTDCLAGALPVASFPAGSFDVSLDPEQLKLNWDTDGPETDPIDPDAFYRLRLDIGGQVVAFLDLDPQLPGPGQAQCAQVISGPCYAFQLGEVIPVKVFPSDLTLCPLGSVECQSEVCDFASGCELTLAEQGDLISVDVPPNAVPGAEAVLLVAQRRLGECFALDAHEISGDNACLQVDAYPELENGLLTAAGVLICYDDQEIPPGSIQSTIVRKHDDEYEALQMLHGACPEEEAGLLDVPESGLFRYAALGINAVARFVGPEPLAARRLIAGHLGLSLNFSDFSTWVLGHMFPVSGDGMTFRVGQAPSVANVVIGVEDADGVRIPGATLHFSSADGTVSSTDVVTDANGEAPVAWDVNTATAGVKHLSVCGVGLFANPLQDHFSEGFTFQEECITVTATVCEAGYGTATVDGSFSAAEYGCAVEFPFTANVSGGNGTPAVVYLMNDATNLYATVRVLQASNKVNSVRFDFDNDGDGVAAPGDDVIGFDFKSMTFYDKHLTENCFKGNQSGCGDNDAVVHGAGAVGSDGTWTTTELSHPLSSGDGQDFDLEVGDIVSWFTSLSLGNGAQGNTQHPDFRQFDRSFQVK